MQETRQIVEVRTYGFGSGGGAGPGSGGPGAGGTGGGRPGPVRIAVRILMILLAVAIAIPALALGLGCLVAAVVFGLAVWVIRALFGAFRGSRGSGHAAGGDGLRENVRVKLPGD